MQARAGLRARADFDVLTRQGGLVSRCRAVDLSASGILINRGRPLRSTDEPLLVDLELRLPEPPATLHAKGRSVWSRGTQQAFRFVALGAVDRLTLAELVDSLSRRGVAA